MVIGLDIFKKYFEKFPDKYVIIGGTACDIIIDEAGFKPRATKDIDIILVVEALDADFVKQFWTFIQDGDYERKEKSNDDRQYYRFLKPINQEFPYQIELFARKPDLIKFEEQAHLTLIPVDDDLSSLSAILMNDDYYHYVTKCSAENDGLSRANIEALICLKAKAFLDIKDRIDNGSQGESKNLKKHKADVFRLTVMLTADDEFDVPPSIHSDLKKFADTMETEGIPDKAIFNEMGISSIKPEVVFEQFKKSFKITG